MRSASTAFAYVHHSAFSLSERPRTPGSIRAWLEQETVEYSDKMKVRSEERTGMVHEIACMAPNESAERNSTRRLLGLSMQRRTVPGAAVLVSNPQVWNVN